jgi:flagellar protein FlgJ
MDAVGGASPRPTSTTPTPAEQRRLRDTASEVESIFLSHMLKTMRQASGIGGTLLSGTGQRVYREMMDEQLGRALAKGGGIGLADMLIRDVLRRQGVIKNPSSPPTDVPMGSAGGLP